MLGAWVSHQFFFNGFGVSSYLLCILFFVGGMNILTGKNMFSFKRHLRYVIAGVIYFSVLLAFIGKSSSFPWGGAFGNMSVNWLNSLIGWFGTAAVLLVAGIR